jgi:hypothetical protein
MRKQNARNGPWLNDLGICTIQEIYPEVDKLPAQNKYHWIALFDIYYIANFQICSETINGVKIKQISAVH